MIILVTKTYVAKKVLYKKIWDKLTRNHDATYSCFLRNKRLG